jgi:methyl-accepting chemotaxis protein
MSENYSLWRSMKLRQKLGLLVAMFTLVLAGLIGFNVAIIHGQKASTLATDVAGRQRMLSQRYLKEAMAVTLGLAQPQTAAATLETLKGNLTVLAGGGPVVLDANTGERGDIPPAPTNEIRARLGEQGALIRQLEAAGQAYFAIPAGDARRADRLREMLDLQHRLTAEAESVVRLYDQHSSGRIETLVFLQVTVGCAAALIGLILSRLMSRQIADPLSACAEAAHQIAQGNLRIEPLPVSSDDEIGMLQKAFNDMLASLRDISLQSRTVCESLTQAVAQILASTQQQAAGTKQQAAAVQEITSTVEEISLSGKQVAERARDVAATAEAVAASGNAGLQAVRETSNGMEAIREQAETVAENVVTLSERTQAVGEIIATVNDIAEQSNLVALNAAIEAAGAREEGRRFAVVANEIKNLADQAKEATAQVRAILEQTQKGINTSVLLTEEALKRVEAGRERTSQSEQVIHQMADNIEESLRAFQQIVGATNQQQIGLEQVTQALHEIRHASQQTAATTAQLERASIELTQLGAQLSKALEKYRL